MSLVTQSWKSHPVTSAVSYCLHKIATLLSVGGTIQKHEYQEVRGSLEAMLEDGCHTMENACVRTHLTPMHS